MRIICKLKTEKLPIDYHFLFVSIIKKALNIIDKNYCNNLYNYEINKTNKKSKNFTFCILLDSYKIYDDNFIMNKDSYVNFKVSSADVKFLMFLYNGLLRIKKYKYKDYSIEILKVRKEHQKEIKDNKINCVFKSPLVIKDKKGKFINYEDKEFENELNYYADINLKNYRGYGLKQKIIVVPENMKKIIVKEKNEKFKKLKNNTLFINASIGEMKMQGDKKDLQDLYDIGLGARRSQGFGYFDIY